MLEMINFVFPISASMEVFPGGDHIGTDDGCLEKVTDLWMKINSPPP